MDHTHAWILVASLQSQGGELEVQQWPDGLLHFFEQYIGRGNNIHAGGMDVVSMISAVTFK
jgi:hypothetical protein